jgi:hypothetical protein
MLIEGASPEAFLNNQPCAIFLRIALQMTGCVPSATEDRHRNGSENARDL